MANKTVTFANSILTTNLITTPAYLALLNSAGTEISGGSYVRRLITVATPANGKTQSTIAITFPVATADWGTVSKWGVMSAISGGTMMYTGSFPAEKKIKANDPAFAVGIGAISFEER